MVFRHQFVPIYLKLTERLLREISALPAGTRIPSEHELASKYGIDRLTARNALKELERRYVVRRVRGSGTFVARWIDYYVGPDENPTWSEVVRKAGGSPRNETESLKLTNPIARPCPCVARIKWRGKHMASPAPPFDGELATCADTYVSKAAAPTLDQVLGPSASLE